MFYSATPELGVRKIDVLNRQDDPSCWVVVPVAPGVALYFAILNEQTGSLGRIIAALTGSPAYHVETWLDDPYSSKMSDFAESRLGEPYDFEGALLAWKDTGFHVQGHEFCSGFAYEILKQILQGLQPYPNPGKLLSQVPAMVGLPTPRLSMPTIEIGDIEYDYLQSLVPDKIATGTIQEVAERLQM